MAPRNCFRHRFLFLVSGFMLFRSAFLPFSLVTFLEYVANLEDYDDSEKEDFVVEIKSFKNSLTVTSKKEMFERLLRLWAKGTKQFPELVQFMRNELAGWMTNRLFDGTFEWVKGFLPS